MKNTNRVLYSMAICLLISGCQSSPSQIENQIKCEEPRPEMCTMNYLPVCGLNSDKSVKTYSNACTACSDKQVVSYKDGAC